MNAKGQNERKHDAFKLNHCGLVSAAAALMTFDFFTELGLACSYG